MKTKYSVEFRLEVVQYQLKGHSKVEAARKFGINPNLLQKWIKAARNDKIATTISQPLKSLTSNINHTLIEHEPAFLPITLQSRSHHEQTPQATALAQTITGVELQIPSHNGTPIKLTIDQIDNYSLIELLRGLQ